MMNYTESTAMDVVTRNNGKITGKLIACERPGLKVLGAIDYLVNYCKYTRVFA